MSMPPTPGVSATRPACRVQGCEKSTQRDHRMCSMHRARMARWGTTDPGPQAFDRTTEERFWLRVAKAAPGECWGWTGAANDKGYGQVTVMGQAVKVYAHRLSYEMHRGPIPDGYEVLHACDNPPCTNPDHLSVGTTEENSVDAQRKGRLRKRLDARKVREIRRLHRGGIAKGSLAAIFAVTTTCINDVVNRRTWRYID